MRVSKKTTAEIADRFEAALDFVPALDPVAFYVKREAAEHAAQVVVAFLKECTR